MIYIIDNPSREVKFESNDSNEIQTFLDNSNEFEREDYTIEEHSDLPEFDSSIQYKSHYYIEEEQKFLEENKWKYITFSERRVRDTDEYDDDWEQVEEYYFVKKIIKCETYTTYQCWYEYDGSINRLQWKRVYWVREELPDSGSYTTSKFSDDRWWITKCKFLYTWEYTPLLNLKF